MRALKNTLITGAALLALCGLQTVQGKSIDVDQILAPGDVVLSELSGTVEMEIDLATKVLTITLVNTSSDAAGSGAGVLLTGIGFNMPGGVSIDHGTVKIASGSVAVNFTANSDDVSSEWGYDDGGLQSGALQGAANVVNTAVSTMESQTTSQFAPGSIVNPPNLDGPDMGLLSNDELDGQGNGIEAIQNSVVITLWLRDPNGKKIDEGFLDDLNDSWVALTFGSPGNGSVPDASSAIALMGLALMGLEGIRRKIGRV